MSFQGKRELLAQVAPRYREAGHEQKRVILNEFIAATGYARKYAIRLLSLPVISSSGFIRRSRPRQYGKEVQEALHTAWAAANYIGSKRLAPFLVELVPALEQHGHLKLTEEARGQLICISHATIDRILRPVRVGEAPRGISTTKRGTLLKHQVPVRTFADWNEIQPGFLEADLVAHCGRSVEGAFLHTLVLTDIATAWVECIPLRYRSQSTVIQALDRARRLLPFPILGLDTDNGTEFLNAELLAYCEREKITFTRGRAYKKNDQCFVEQKNGAVVRQLVGYDRFEGEKAYRQLAELYRGIRLYINFFQPSMKLKTKHREGSRVRCTYDNAQTPFQRLRPSLDVAGLKRLQAIFQALDPVRLLRQIEALQDALWKHAVLTITGKSDQHHEAETGPEVRFAASTCGGHLPEKANLSMGSKPLTRAGERKKRKYHRTKPPQRTRHWRTRKDPFETVWEEICQWLAINPERTAKSLFVELQQHYPGVFANNQLRTLQRRVQAWRAQAILTFDDQWLEEELIAQEVLPRPLGVMLEPMGNPGLPG
jgi:hypothetical protein